MRAQNFSRRALSLAVSPGPANVRKEKFSLDVVSFWRPLGVGDGAWLDGAASRFQPCLDCHIV